MSSPAVPRGSGPSLSLGQIAFGVFLVLLGAGWLLDAAGVWSVSWGAALPIALIAVGALLMVGSTTRGHGGLVVLGIALTVVLGVMTTLNVPFEGNVGDTAYQPATIQQVQSTYRLAVGNQTVDLSGVSFPAGTTRVTASTAVGQLIVEVPAGVGVRVHVTVGAGDASIFGRDYSGASVDETYTSDNYQSAASKVDLELSTGLGTIEVR
ncbi:MAG TPA: cell wall-active antibiotics response protein LiaF [Thermomicrobiaceae bacterium]|nr:cell wall-active antibiotics response protein LiaF [Thermomicrobiaceae bacterium]